MHSAMKRGVVVAAVLAGAVACADKAPKVASPGGRVITSKPNETVTVTANCTAGNQIDVAVDKWLIGVKKNGEVTFLLTSASSPAPDVTVLEKSTGQWPFIDRTPIKPGNGKGNGPGGGKGKAKADTGTYQYNLRVVCGTGPAARIVVIDPDIFVD